MARKLWILDQPISRVINDNSDQIRWELINKPRIKKQPRANKGKGKESPNREINHHFPGGRKGLAQASRKRTTATIFGKMNNRRGNFRSLAMTYPKLQICSFRCP